MLNFDLARGKNCLVSVEMENRTSFLSNYRTILVGGGKSEIEALQINHVIYLVPGICSQQARDSSSLLLTTFRKGERGDTAAPAAGQQKAGGGSSNIHSSSQRFYGSKQVPA